MVIESVKTPIKAGDVFKDVHGTIFVADSDEKTSRCGWKKLVTVRFFHSNYNYWHIREVKEFGDYKILSQEEITQILLER